MELESAWIRIRIISSKYMRIQYTDIDRTRNRTGCYPVCLLSVGMPYANTGTGTRYVVT